MTFAFPTVPFCFPPNFLPDPGRIRNIVLRRDINVTMWYFQFSQCGNVRGKGNIMVPLLKIVTREITSLYYLHSCTYLRFRITQLDILCGLNAFISVWFQRGCVRIIKYTFLFLCTTVVCLDNKWQGSF